MTQKHIDQCVGSMMIKMADLVSVHTALERLEEYVIQQKFKLLKQCRNCAFRSCCKEGKEFTNGNG